MVKLPPIPIPESGTESSSPVPPPIPPVEVREPDQAPTKKPKKLSGLTCSSCGGTVEVQEGWTNVECQYCQTGLAVVGERGFTRLMVLDRIDRAKASRIVRQWLKTGIRKEPALKREAKYEEAFLAFFPFVRAHFDLVGWVLGVIKKKRKRGDRWETVEKPVERQIEKSMDLTIPAGEMAEFGVHRVSLDGDELLPADEDSLRKRGMLFRPYRATREAAAELMESSLRQANEKHRLHRTTYRWLAVVRSKTTLVYYPLWVFRYSFRGRTFQVLVDAEDGTIAYGKAPGNHLYRAFALVSACAGACFVGTTMLQHLGFLLRSENGFAALGVVGLILAALVGWGFSQFRHGGIVEEGTGLAVEKEAESAAKALKRALDEL